MKITKRKTTSTIFGMASILFCFFFTITNIYSARFAFQLSSFSLSLFLFLFLSMYVSCLWILFFITPILIYEVDREEETNRAERKVEEWMKRRWGETYSRGGCWEGEKSRSACDRSL